MNRKNLSTLVGLILVVAVAAPLQAQSTITKTMTVDVPFAFSAGNKLMPASHYTVQVISESGMVVLRREGQTPLILMSTPKEDIRGSGHAKLIFRRLGASYFLAEVWSEGNTTGNAFRPIADEKQIARNEQSKQVLMVQARQVF